MLASILREHQREDRCLSVSHRLIPRNSDRYSNSNSRGKFFENNIFEEFSGCTNKFIEIIDKSEILKSLNDIIVSCKDVNFKIFGISLAGINLLLSLLIVAYSIRTLVYENPKKRSAGLDVYENVQEDHDYVMSVDVARGVGGDYSAFVVVDITCLLYTSDAADE